MCNKYLLSEQLKKATKQPKNRKQIEIIRPLFDKIKGWKKIVLKFFFQFMFQDECNSQTV